MSKKSLILMIILFGLVTFYRPVFGVATGTGGDNSAEIEALNKSIAEKQKKVKEIEQAMADYQKKISATRLEAVSLANQISILDNHLAQIELDISATTNKVDALGMEIEAIDLSMTDKEKTITRQKKIIAELLREISQNDNKNYLEIFAAYQNFSDFYNQVQYIQTIQTDLGQSARALRIAKEELQLKKDQKETIKKTYLAAKEELSQKKKDLEEQTSGKSTLLAYTHSSELKYKTLVASLKKQNQQIEGEIAGIEKEVRNKLEAQKKISDTVEDAAGLLSWPTQSRYLTAIFHDPGYPFRNIFEHSAIDIRASYGTTLHAAASGYVARAKRCTLASCYSYVMLVHSGGISTVYGHMSQITVSEDQYVARGDIIGLSGGTPGTVGAGPFVTGPHLHFEVRKDGVPVNPLGYLIKDY